jgi:RNA polymerase sigma-70 factor (ECF subfamily)
MENDSDATLARLAAGGDADAFEALVHRHYDAVYRLAFRWCRIREDAEDIAQEVFVKLARNMKRFAGRSAFRTWLYRIVVNTAKDFHRSNATRRRHEESLSAEHRIENPGPSGEEALLARNVVEAVDRLPGKQKSAVLLVLAEGFSHREAAEVLGCSETTVSWRIFMARKKLRKELRPKA